MYVHDWYSQMCEQMLGKLAARDLRKVLTRRIAYAIWAAHFDVGLVETMEPPNKQLQDEMFRQAELAINALENRGANMLVRRQGK